MKDYQKIVSQVLSQLGFEELKEIQHEIITKFQNHKNVILLAPTGSGKTLGFLIPMLQTFDPDSKNVQGLIIVPTRELALQVLEVFKSIKSPFKATCVYGGHEMRIERNALVDTPALVIGTPGRLIDHIAQENIDLSDTKLIVLDEFDKSLELGFEDQIGEIFKSIKLKQGFILTSATDLRRLPDFLPFDDSVKLNFIGETEKNLLKQKVVHAQTKVKGDILLSLVSGFKGEQCIIFCNHREAVNRLSQFFHDFEYPHAILHGGLEQQDREINLIKFRNGSSSILIATDLASRGLDIPDIKHVIHYQLPKQEDAYIHRNGRTARMEAEGTSYVFLTDDEYLPRFIEGEVEICNPDEKPQDLILPAYECIFISAGKSDKISKGDIVGLLTKKGGIKGDDIGQIYILDKASYVAVKRNLSDKLVHLVNKEKLKKVKVKIDIAK
ncbi:DEAD/DEAH box helicase [Belliella kenyensis]|uniref:DEAD/DEAH box helicase n=1 Tax=Belliella kenyensis TaxID=1472724 RepID=A0ABV8EIP0_9BACT|nr:DEAD/DEAH box helicase [Belliella kenyensis]MCH7400270.1 DEAD/DEAH box helicase [Belliella kenyensis]